MANNKFFENIRLILTRRRVIVYIIVAIAMFYLFMLPFIHEIAKIFFIGLFLVLGSLSYFYRRVFQMRIGIEFIFPATVLTTLAYGAGMGFFVANVTNFLAELIGFKLDQRMLFGQISVNLIVILTPTMWSFTNHSWILTGLLLNIIYHLTVAPPSILLGGNPGKSLVFVSTNLFWILLFFLRIAPLIGPLMGIQA